MLSDCSPHKTVTDSGFCGWCSLALGRVHQLRVLIHREPDFRVAELTPDPRLRDLSIFIKMPLSKTLMFGRGTRSLLLCVHRVRPLVSGGG